ncbi:hypothetical protein POM88_035553 [Heracleum sosnowskyi]|uniref:RNase H type-1 domain-containing protein n=1 Tax=Heracleum sosnowskyi TaxID=360622 RepID=A0AAD8HMP0_9APIA|nr:hypothetical protein POM88_035553 [Heracleum sosnowskyi]
MAAARFGLIVAERFGYCHIQLESDALEVLNYFNDARCGYSPTYLLVEDLHAVSSKFTSFYFSHVKRRGNSVAHLIDRSSIVLSDECIYVGNFLPGILALAEFDFT